MMLSRAAQLNLLLHNLDWITITDIENRQILQKTVYILQEFGWNENYTYNWYIGGPYSPALMEDIFDICENQDYYDEAIEGYKCVGRGINIINNYKKIFGEKINDKEWLELFVSLLFIKKHYNLIGTALKDKLFESRKKYIDKQDLVDEALTYFNLSRL